MAQAPQKMSYQAVIRDDEGNLVKEQAVGMKVSILQESAAGSVVFSETFTPASQTNTNGLVTFEIGAHQKGLVEELEKAHIYIEQLNNRMKVLETTVEKLVEQIKKQVP